MEYAVSSGADEQSATASRPVAREAKSQLGHLGLDSLYLVVEYPCADLYRFWLAAVQDVSDLNLNKGIVCDGLVVRRGAHGYKLSVWDEEDARLYLTDRVTETLAGSANAGEGMGLMLQLGPKWLAQYGDVVWSQKLIENVHAQLVVFGLVNPQDFRIRLNRVDIALDVLGVDIGAFSIDHWLRDWVGYAALSAVIFDKRRLQSLRVGSSSGSVMLRVYDKLVERIQSGKSTFWRSVWGLAEPDNLGQVQRDDLELDLAAGGEFTPDHDNKIGSTMESVPGIG